MPEVSELRGRTVLPQIESLDHEHDERVEFFMTVDNSNQISRVSLCEDLKLDQVLVPMGMECRTAKTYFKAGCNKSRSFS
jgi:hypothetical protein